MERRRILRAVTTLVVLMGSALLAGCPQDPGEELYEDQEVEPVSRTAPATAVADRPLARA